MWKAVCAKAGPRPKMAVACTDVVLLADDRPLKSATRSTGTVVIRQVLAPIDGNRASQGQTRTATSAPSTRGPAMQPETHG